MLTVTNATLRLFRSLNNVYEWNTLNSDNQLSIPSDFFLVKYNVSTANQTEADLQPLIQCYCETY